jgi:hypothetical protein
MKKKIIKRAVVKEELYSLTGDLIDSLILNELIYWSMRCGDVKEYIQEEIQGSKKEYGWFWKSSKELSDECMLGIQDNAVRVRLKKLEASGWIISDSENRNFKKKAINTISYRVELRRILNEVYSKGYDVTKTEFFSVKDTKKCGDILKRLIATTLSAKVCTLSAKVCTLSSKGTDPSEKGNNNKEHNKESQGITGNTEKLVVQASPSSSCCVCPSGMLDTPYPNSLRTSSPTANNDLPADPAADPPPVQPPSGITPFLSSESVTDFQKEFYSIVDIAFAHFPDTVNRSVRNSITRQLLHDIKSGNVSFSKLKESTKISDSFIAKRILNYKHKSDKIKSSSIPWDDGRPKELIPVDTHIQTDGTCSNCGAAIGVYSSVCPNCKSSIIADFFEKQKFN